MHRLPFEAEAQEHRGRILAPSSQVVGTDDLDAPSTEGRAQDQHAQGLGHPQHAHREADERQRQGQLPGEGAGTPTPTK
jgi:hypothetical protein